MTLTTPIVHNGVEIQVPINPFFHRTNWSWVQKIKVSILVLTLFPIRLVLMSIFLLFSWILALIATINMPAQSAPLSRWRRACRWIIAKVLMRITFFIFGFYWINIKGRQASRKDAPILVVAPHSSLADVIPLAFTGGPTIVMKSDAANMCLFSRMIGLCLPLYVSRDVTTSRAEIAREIINRSRSELDWPQIYIYPEATCTNRSCLITFNKGAFNPGVPVQPVIIRYPNHNDTVTWTFDSLTKWQFLYLCGSQFYLRLDIEFLPVYYPNNEEKVNSVLFAKNVRKVMAEKLQIPVLDYTFQDGMYMQRMIRKDALNKKFRQLSKLRQELNMIPFTELSVSRRTQTTGTNWEKTPREFITEFDLQGANPVLITKLFALFDTKNIGKIDLREYFVYSTILNHNLRTDKILSPLFAMYSNSQTSISQHEFKKLMQGVFGMAEDYADTYFRRDMGNGNLNDNQVIDRDQFNQKIMKCLDYLRIYALEATRIFSVYPIRPNP